MLGRTVDISNATTTVSGEVKSISFSNGAPQVTIQTTDGQTVANISIADIARIR